MVVVVLLILCCLCSLISGGAGFYYYQNNPGMADAIIPSAQNPIPNQVNVGEVIRSEEGGFAFKMIPDYKLITFMKETGTLSLNLKDKTITIIGDGPEIMLSGGVNSKKFTLDQYAKRGNSIDMEHYKATSSAAQQVTIAGIKGIAYDYDYEIADIGKIKSRVIYVVVNSNQLFSIECRSRVGDWDKMLADFNLVAQSVTLFEPVHSPTQIP